MPKEIRGLWFADPQSPFLNGHFPGRPILPAIQTVELSIDFLRRQLQQPNLKIQSVKSAKFASPISPGMTVETSASEVRPNEWQLELQERGSGRQLASLRLVFAG